MSAEPARARWLLRCLAAPLALASAACGLTGCARAGEPIAVLPGARVARMAEARLEAEDPGMAPGTLRCPDLDFVIGAATRCVRTAMLSRGRVVRVLGTIRVVSTRGGGELHVALDDAAAGFGLTGSAVAARVRDRLHRRGMRPVSVDCPYLDGEVGVTVACKVVGRTGASTAVVTATAVHPATYDVDVGIEIPTGPGVPAPG